MTKKSRRKFSGDFKAKVVLEALKERSTMEELARKYDLHPTQINTWKREAAAKQASAFETEGAVSNTEQQEDQLEKLYAQIGQLKVENDFLKKKVALKSLPLRRDMIDPDHGGLSMRQQCRILGLHRSGLYYKPVYMLLIMLFYR
jgi:transposase-like protein